MLPGKLGPGTSKEGSLVSAALPDESKATGRTFFLLLFLCFIPILIDLLHFFLLFAPLIFILYLVYYYIFLLHVFSLCYVIFYLNH